MRKQLYWLSDSDWKRLEPLLPRGRRGAHRVDDRRVISGIMHMLRSGARWRDCPPEYGPYTTIYNRFNRWSRQGIWFAMFEALTGSIGIIGTVAIDSSHIKAHRSAGGGRRGTFKEAIGRSRGGRTTKIHALTDAQGRPRVLLLSPGNINDIALAPALIAAVGPIKRLIADKAYDANSLRQLLADHGVKAVIPSTTNRNQPIPYSKILYRQRNLIERMFARLKDFRRIATRYDKLARNFLAGAMIVATLLWWLN